MLLIDNSMNSSNIRGLEDVASIRAASREDRTRVTALGYEDTGRLYEVEPEEGREHDFASRLYFFLARERLTIIEELAGPLWGNLKDRYHPNGATLMTCAKEFLDYNRHYTDGRNARGQCGSAASQFRELLLNRGVISHDDVAKGRAGLVEILEENEIKEPIFYHAWFHIGDINIDWTYRQFHKDSPFPFIFHERNSPWKGWGDKVKRESYSVG